MKKHSDSKSKYSKDDIIKMLEFLVDILFFVFAGTVFQQTVCIQMGTNCTSPLADIFLKQLASRLNIKRDFYSGVNTIFNRI